MNELTAKSDNLTLQEISDGTKMIPVKTASGKIIEINLALVEKLAAQGMKLSEIAPFFGMSTEQLRKQKKINDRLEQAIEQGKSKGIAGVSNKLMQNAMDGNIIAQIFYLKCQAGWREADKTPQQENTKDRVTIYLPDNGRGDSEI